MTSSRYFVPGVMLVFLGFFVFDIWLIFIRSAGAWRDQAGLWFGLIGIFALATGFVSATELRTAIPYSALENLTSPRPREFVFGSVFLIGLAQSFGLALLYGRVPWESVRRAGTLDQDASFWPLDVSLYIVTTLVKIIATFIFAVVWFTSIVAYFVLVVPAAYPAYAAVGYPLIAMREGNADASTIVHYDGLDPREIIREHEVSLRAFAVGGLGTISALVLKASVLY